MNIYYLEGEVQNFDFDNAAIVGSDQSGIMVECSMEEASRLANEWQLRSPMLAKDGVHYSESGDVVYIANGEIVDNIEDVAQSLDWPGFECGLDAEDYLHSINRIF
jgi:hypothetical protein